MSLRSRKSAANRFEIDDVLDDLLASDGDGSAFQKKETKIEPKPKSPAKSKKLTAAASDAEFYSNLKSLGGADMDHSEEEEELSDGAVERLAAQIGNLDDLDDDLFGGFGNHDGKKTAEGNPVTTPKTSVESDVNKTKVPLKRELSLNDDPLSGLGLSDDDIDLALNKKKAGKKSLLTRSSSYQKGARIEPHGTIGNENEENKLSQSLENGDPFLTSLTSVASRKQVSKQNSDEFLGGNLNASDSDVSPRQQAVKQRRSKARRNRKGSVTPSDGDNTDVDAFLNKPAKTCSTDSLPDQNNALLPSMKVKSDTKRKGEDLFDDSDDLPGMSDEELPEKHIRTVQSGGNSKAASSALDSLLTHTSIKQKQEPTMLEKIMAGKSATKSEEKLSVGYSPSAASERPTTAPHRRSVTFADQLGADILSENSSRPISAPEGKQGREKKAEYPGGNDLDSDLDETTKEWLSLSKSKQEKKIDKRKDESSKKSSNDDWLGLGADLTDSFKLESSGELFTPKNDEKNETSTPSGEAASETNASKSESTWPVNRKQEEAKPKSVSKGQFEKSNLLWETPSNRPSTKPPSRHRTPEKEKGTVDKPSPALAKTENELDLPKQAVFTSTPKAMAGSEEDGEFLSLLRRSKEKQQIEKSDNGESSHPELSVNMMEIQIDNNSSLTEQLRVPPKYTDTGLHITNDITTNDSSNNQRQKIKPPIEVDVNNLVSKQDPAIIQLLSQLVLQSPHGTMAQTESDVSTATTSGVPIAPPLSQVRALKDEVMKSLDLQHQEEFNAVKRQFERDRSYLEAEVKELQTKVLQLEESRTCSTAGYSKSVRELEANVRKLELERDQLLISLDSLRERHKSEIDALEASHKTRIGFLEDAHKQRELQHTDEAQMEKEHYEQRLKSLLNEKEDILQTWRKKEDLWDKAKMADINRLKSLHEKTLEELISEHNSQLEHLKMIKEQEVAAALSAFSHTKSLQGLMQEVQDSARQVSSLHAKIDASHKSQTDTHEMTLKSKEDYLKNLQERLIQQERNNEEERKHLQSLIAKMEIQLQEQTHQIEQDKWKVSQEESRLKMMQSAFDEEKRIMVEKIMQDREQVSKAREEMLVDQRKVITECCEEKRKIENERIKLSVQRDPMDQSSLRLFNSDPSDFEKCLQDPASFNELMRERVNLMQEQKEVQKAIADVRAASDRVEQLSKEVEEFSHEAKRVYEKGMEASLAAQCRQSELDDMNKQLDGRMATVQHLEEKLKEEQDMHHMERALMEREKEGNKCLNCRTPLPTQHEQHQQQQLQVLNQQLQQEQHQKQSHLLHQVIPQLQQQELHKHTIHESFDQPTMLNTQQQQQQLMLSQHPPLVTPHHQINILSSVSQKQDVQSTNTPPNHQAYGNTNANLSTANASVLQYNGEQRQTSTPSEIMLEAGSRIMGPNVAYSIDNEMRTYSVDSLMGIMNNQDVGRNANGPVRQGVNDSDASSLPPPDLLMNSFEYKRAMRRYSHEKGKDDNYLEEEARFLKMLHERRLR